MSLENFLPDLQGQELIWPRTAQRVFSGASAREKGVKPLVGSLQEMGGNSIGGLELSKES